MSRRARLAKLATPIVVDSGAGPAPGGGAATATPLKLPYSVTSAAGRGLVALWLLRSARYGFFGEALIPECRDHSVVRVLVTEAGAEVEMTGEKVWAHLEEMCLGALEEAITQVVTAEDVVAPDWLSVHARRPATRAQA